MTFERFAKTPPIRCRNSHKLHATGLPTLTAEIFDPFSSPTGMRRSMTFSNRDSVRTGISSLANFGLPISASNQ